MRYELFEYLFIYNIDDVWYLFLPENDSYTGFNLLAIPLDIYLSWL